MLPGKPNKRRAAAIMAGAFLLGAVSLCAGNVVRAQQAQQPAQQPAWSIDTIPSFRITLVDGKVYTKAKLKPHTPLMIIYFSPDCDHCQHFAQALAPHLDKFKGTQIVMVTFLPPAKLVGFARTYKLDKPFITIGTEGFSFIVRNYFKVQNFPFIALYDKHGKLAGIYREPPADISLLSNGLLRKVK
jgi:hypothetical protein